MIRYLKDIDNIVTLTLDMEGRRKNILNHELAKAFNPVVEHLISEKEKGALKGVIITSAKNTFLFGGDLDYLLSVDENEKLQQFAREIKEVFRALESPGVPVVAAINGSALGIGFELALACHHRVVIKDPSIRLGHPEVGLGFMPSGGGVVRLLWLLGVEKAFRFLETGKGTTPNEALQMGVIDELAANEKEMLEKAKCFCLETSEGRRPWDRPDGKIPGGDSKSVVRRLAAENFKAYRGRPNARQSILNTLADGAKLDFDTASKIETRHSAQLFSLPGTRNMIKAFWTDRNAIRKGLSRPKGFGKFRPKRIGIIGAGRMGSAIALTCLQNGMKVVLKDVSKMVAEQGRIFIRNEMQKLLEAGHLTDKMMSKQLKNVETTDTPEDFRECDLVIEAVFENENLKRKVTKESESYLDEYAIFGTNTISIPITKLAKASLRPGNYVGLHFFHPVLDVPLVEIVIGKQTSDETIARAFDFVKSIL